MRRNIFFMPNNKWQLEMHALMNDIKKPVKTQYSCLQWSVLLSPDQTRTQAHRKFYFTRFLSELRIKFWCKTRFRFGLNILLFFSKTMKKRPYLQVFAISVCIKMFCLHACMHLLFLARVSKTIRPFLYYIFQYFMPERLKLRL